MGVSAGLNMTAVARHPYLAASVAITKMSHSFVMESGRDSAELVLCIEIYILLLISCPLLKIVNRREQIPLSMKGEWLL